MAHCIHSSGNYQFLLGLMWVSMKFYNCNLLKIKLFICDIKKVLKHLDASTEINLARNEPRSWSQK